MEYAKWNEGLRGAEKQIKTGSYDFASRTLE